MRTRLTDLSVNAIKTPESGQVFYWDQSLKGFGLRVSVGGAKALGV